MKILVLGASEVADHIMAPYFKERSYDVTSFTHRPISYCESMTGDATKSGDVEIAVFSGNLDVVINTIGMLNRSAEDHRSMAVMLNGYLSRFVADTPRENKTKPIHMSTDCAFARNTGPYHEDSFPDEMIFYDRSRAIREVNDDKNPTFRNFIIELDINKKGIGLLNWLVKQEDSINGFTEATWTGATTSALVKAVEEAVKQNLTGLYSLVNNESINKFDLCILFNEHFRNGRITIDPSGKPWLDKSLHHRRIDFSFVAPSYKQQIKGMADWVNTHREFCPHYFK